MAFVKKYTEEITLIYYCLNLALTLAIFIVGACCLRQRDKRDQQRREWCQFAERIYSEYTKLKDKDIPRRILKVRDTFEEIQINSTTTGLDVLRYMLGEGNYESFKTIQLEYLREELQLIFFLFNVCSSLLLLGNNPKNVKEELSDLISDLGQMAVPFFKGKQREVILKCLKHFSTDRPRQESDDELGNVPYVNCLTFGERFPDGTGGMEHKNRGDYSECRNFSLCIKESSPQRSDLTFLQELHKDLKDASSDPRYLAHFASELREKPPVRRLDSIEEITNFDTDKRVVEKVLHEVRVYIYLLQNESQHRYQDQIRVNVTRLCKVQEKIIKVRPIEAVVKGICERFIEDLKGIQTSKYHCNSQEFCDKLKQLQHDFQEIQFIRQSRINSTSLPSTSQVGNQRQETIL